MFMSDWQKREAEPSALGTESESPPHTKTHLLPVVNMKNNM